MVKVSWGFSSTYFLFRDKVPGFFQAPSEKYKRLNKAKVNNFELNKVEQIFPTSQHDKKNYPQTFTHSIEKTVYKRYIKDIIATIKGHTHPTEVCITFY